MRTIPLLLVLALVGCSDTSESADTDTDTDTDPSTTSTGDESSTTGDESSTGPGLSCEADVMISRGDPIDPDGTIDPLEWANATIVTIPVQDTDVQVTLKHDGERLNVGFQPLAEGGLIMFPEIYIDPLNDKTPMFGADDWWFHTDDQECGAQGQLDAWPMCVDDNPDWETTPGYVGPANVVEFAIPFELLGIDLTTTCEFGFALRLTNTQTISETWPATAARDEPVTWTTVALAL